MAKRLVANWIEFDVPTMQHAYQIGIRLELEGSPVKKHMLFLCTGNSCRSQMAEGWARHFHGDQIEAYSAGIEAHGMNPNAMKVMGEAGVDIAIQSSKLASSLKDVPLDLVITVCGHADENCPAFLTKAKLVHVGFDDPPKQVKDSATEEEAL